MEKNKANSRGFSLVEVLVGIGLATLLTTSTLVAFLGAGVMGSMAKHRSQAVQVVRSKVEELKIMPFNQIVDATSTVSYDAGADGIFGNADDRQGALAVTVRDFLDMDSDGNTSEAAIDIDGGGNDPSAAKPVRVTFTWSGRVLGQTKNMSAFADTLIAA